MPDEIKMVQVNIQVPVDLKSRLDRAAQADGGRSKSSAIRRAIQDYSDRILGERESLPQPA